MRKILNNWLIMHICLHPSTKASGGNKMALRKRLNTIQVVERSNQFIIVTYLLPVLVICTLNFMTI